MLKLFQYTRANIIMLCFITVSYPNLSATEGFSTTFEGVWERLPEWLWARRKEMFLETLLRKSLSGSGGAVSFTFTWRV